MNSKNTWYIYRTQSKSSLPDFNMKSRYHVHGSVSFVLNRRYKPLYLTLS